MACRSRILPTLKRTKLSPRYAVSAQQLRAPLQCRWQTNAAPEAKPQDGTKTIKFTTESYPEIKRDSRFAEITPEHVEYFKGILGKESALIDGVTKDATDDMEPFNGDWMRKYRGHTKLVLKPGSTEEVSKILKYCNDNMLAVVPQGGNTGLVGGSVPVFDEIVIQMGRMNAIRSFDEVSGTLVADAGCILETTDRYLADRGHIFP
ncbi:hypothetical protein V491_03929, partial [Pseudogymnoascus sp. VKM F-3775]